MNDALRTICALGGLIGGLCGLLGAVLVYRMQREGRQAGSRGKHREDPS